jgi:hypothetical protein
MRTSPNASAIEGQNEEVSGVQGFWHLLVLVPPGEEDTTGARRADGLERMRPLVLPWIAADEDER